MMTKSLKRLIIGISQIITLVTMVTKVRRVIYTSKDQPSKVSEPLNLCPNTSYNKPEHKQQKINIAIDLS